MVFQQVRRLISRVFGLWDVLAHELNLFVHRRLEASGQWPVRPGGTGRNVRVEQKIILPLALVQNVPGILRMIQRLDEIALLRMPHMVIVKSGFASRIGSQLRNPSLIAIPQSVSPLLTVMFFGTTPIPLSQVFGPLACEANQIPVRTCSIPSMYGSMRSHRPVSKFCM